MRRATALRFALVCLGLAGCGFPDYGGFKASSQRDGGGAGRDGGGGAASGGSSGSGGEVPDGATGGGGAGGAGFQDARPDAPAGCTGDLDCPGPTGERHCDLTDRACVECRPGGTDCPEGTRCTDARVCAPGCDTAGECVGRGPSRPDAGGDGSAPDAALDGSGDGATGAPDASEDASRDASRDAFPGATEAGSDAQLPDGATRDAGGGLTCDVATHTCVGCRYDADCPLGMLCAGNQRCEPGCTDSRPCPDTFTCCSGECTNLSRATTHCGACDVSCALEGGLGACIAGACQSLTCQEEFGDCNADPGDGCERPLSGDPDNCGACDRACPIPRNASASCTEGACGVGPCLPSFADCDRAPENACEVNLGFSTPNCGTCGFACNLLNANQRCQNGACEITTCKAGFANCDNLASTGCEVNTLSDPSNCGSCGRVCSFTDADAICQAGACRLGPCSAATADCNRLPADGCEVNIKSDAQNCGACARPCSLAHATAACSEGSCTVVACEQGWGDCNGIATDGCEVNLGTSVGNCSACGVACSSNHGTPTCALGACSIRCTGSFKDCDADVTNGCETDTATNVENCNACNRVCSATGGTPNCVAGVCGVSTCGAGVADCNGSPGDGCEVDTTSSVTSCGGCGKTCFVPGGTPGCNAGTCTITRCDTGFGNCDGEVDTGCETRLNTLTSCGACGRACSLARANATCVSGSCEIAACVSPYADCDGIASNGCETDTSRSVPHCGGCGGACSNANGTPACLNSSCAITCSPGFANCNAAVSDGCERVTRDDVNNCGACGAVCAVQNGQPACVGTTCRVASCTAPFADCDGLYATGCEVNTSTRIDHCGGCGRACSTATGTPTCTGGVCIVP